MLISRGAIARQSLADPPVADQCIELSFLLYFLDQAIPLSESATWASAIYRSPTICFLRLGSADNIILNGLL